jgi:hypothetical protein
MCAGELSIPAAKGTMAATMDGSQTGNDMEAQANKSLRTLFWIAGIAVSGFSAVGIAAIMGWIPTSMSSPSEDVAVAKQPVAPGKAAAARAHTASGQTQAQAPLQVANNTPAKAQCAECGVIHSNA